MNGRLVRLWRYPVKSMAAEPMAAVDVTEAGLTGDRRWALVRPDAADRSFPWLTIRERNEMSRYVPSYDDPSDPDRSAVTVRTAAGETLAITDPRLAEDLMPGAELRHDPAGMPDDSPISILSLQSVAALEERSGLALNPLRFRPNLLLDVPGGEFPEEEWIGREIRIGEVVVEVTRRDTRCVIVNVDPETAERDPSLLRTLAAVRDTCAGVYARVVTPGRIAVGDAVTTPPDHRVGS